MDFEFHYYITYLIAARAGFTPNAAYTLAYASNYVDDNDKVFKINEGTSYFYQNYISQTFDITKPQQKLCRIYPLFHFIPGDSEAYGQKLKAKKAPLLNTTPDSENANQIFKQALASENIYRIGIACHAYADSWAHQNFIGLSDQHNVLSTLRGQITPNIGHAEIFYIPDRIKESWRDHRLLESEVDNTERFLEAAGQIFIKLKLYLDDEVKKESLEIKKNSLKADLRKIIEHNKAQGSRIRDYKILSLKNEYGGSAIPTYYKDDWFEKAIRQNPPLEIDLKIKRLNLLEEFIDYTWLDLDSYQDSDWFKFQEAVKEHQSSMLELLEPLFIKAGIELRPEEF